MRLDQQLLLDKLAQYPSPTSVVADFGSGTSRIACALEPLGYRVLNVDLSSHMLRTAQSKVLHREQHAFLHSNLVELQWLKDQCVSVAVCLFSSIGMIRGQENRRQFLRHVRRVLRDDGLFMLHVHNRHHSWLDPQGPLWHLKTYWQSIRSKNVEYGDRVYLYRGLPRMFLHIYSRGELIRDLQSSGFRSIDIQPINIVGTELLPPKTWFTPLRAGGYFAFAK